MNRMSSRTNGMPKVFYLGEECLIEGQVESEHGKPQIVAVHPLTGRRSVLEEGSYLGLATLQAPMPDETVTRREGFFVVAGDYWRGTLPVGVLVRLEVLEQTVDEAHDEAFEHQDYLERVRCSMERTMGEQCKGHTTTQAPVTDDQHPKGSVQCAVAFGKRCYVDSHNNAKHLTDLADHWRNQVVK